MSELLVSTVTGPDGYGTVTMHDFSILSEDEQNTLEAALILAELNGFNVEVEVL